jgi:predicted transglutaminase-like cysteine proteinase
MIFVSINPFALKRFFLFFLAAIGFSCFSCFGQSIFLSVKSTPYDRQMTRIRSSLTEEVKSPSDNVSFGMVDLWMGRLRSIPYGFTREWKTPSETQSGDPADCKAKSVALYQMMRSHGATNLRLIIGRRYATSRMTHAWLEWETSRGTFVLDPTLNWRAVRVSDCNRDSYIPYYAYEGAKRFRTAQVALVAQN